MAGPVPEDGLHANRPFTVPWDGANGPKRCMSRQNILQARVPTAFGERQSMTVAATGEDQKNPDTWPKDWHKAGQVLRVPKCVILSSHPFWTLYWPSGSKMYFPRDIVGQTLTPPFLFGNYYYLEQWNGENTNISAPTPEYTWIHTAAYDDAANASDPTTQDQLYAAANSDPAGGYLSDPFWNTFDHQPSNTDKITIYNQRWVCQQTCSGSECTACEAIPGYLINTCSGGGADVWRFHEDVGLASNGYYDGHQQILETFKAVKAILESDPIDPIYCIIPNWMPANLQQIRNSSKYSVFEKRNVAHGGSPNGMPCDIVDAEPCYVDFPMCWAPPYPDKDDPRNQMGFNGPNVPWLASLDPGFGTNVLHIYVGHANVRYDNGQDIWSYQAWPLFPEGMFIGPDYFGTYLGGATLPTLNGGRTAWRDFGYTYGFGADPIAGADTVYNLYKPLISGAADAWKENYLKFRNIGMRIFTYPIGVNWGWDVTKIEKDKRNDCPATRFYFGLSYSDFAEMTVNEDTSSIDCSTDTTANPAGLKYAEVAGTFPASADIVAAELEFFPPIRDRVETYYGSIELGTKLVFQKAINDNDLLDYNVGFEGALKGATWDFMSDPDQLASYIREYFNTFK